MTGNKMSQLSSLSENDSSKQQHIYATKLLSMHAGNQAVAFMSMIGSGVYKILAFRSKSNGIFVLLLEGVDGLMKSVHLTKPGNEALQKKVAANCFDEFKVDFFENVFASFHSDDPLGKINFGSKYSTVISQSKSRVFSEIQSLFSKAIVLKRNEPNQPQIVHVNEVYDVRVKNKTMKLLIGDSGVPYSLHRSYKGLKLLSIGDVFNTLKMVVKKRQSNPSVVIQYRDKPL